jgi:hypothetical protein
MGWVFALALCTLVNAGLAVLNGIDGSTAIAIGNGFAAGWCAMSALWNASEASR